MCQIPNGVDILRIKTTLAPESHGNHQRTQFGGWSFDSDTPVHGRDPARFAVHPGGREDRPEKAQASAGA